MAYDHLLAVDTTSKLLEVMVRDSTTGAGKTGLAYGSVAHTFWREGAASGTTATCVDMTLGTWTTKGWKELDATNMPGVYQFGIPNAALATGVPAVTISFKASGMIDKTVRILLDLGANVINAASIKDAAIDAATFANDAITAASINTGALTADAFAADALVAATFATDAITDDAIATGAIASTAFAAGAINAAAIASDAIEAAKIKDGAITNAKVADDLDVNVKTITNDAITAAAIANGAIDAATFAAGAITAAAIATDAIDADALKADAITEIQAGLATPTNITAASGVALSATQAAYAPAKAGDAMALTSGERTTLAGVIWALATSGMTTAGSIGKKLADWVVGTIDTYTGNTKQTADNNTILAKVNTTLVQDGAVYDFTAASLAAAPSSSGLDAAGVRTAIGLSTANLDTQLADVPTVAEFEARTLPAADYVVTTDTIAGVTTVTSLANDSITAAALKTDAVTEIQTGLATPTNITAGTITTVTNLTNAPTNGDLTATMKLSVNAEVDAALNTAIPGSPTADSINQRVAAIDVLTEAAGAGDLAAILTDTAEIVNLPTAAGIVDANYKKNITTYNTTGTAGAFLNKILADTAAAAADAASSADISAEIKAGTTLVTIDEAALITNIVPKVWQAALPGTAPGTVYTSGQAGYILSEAGGTGLDATETAAAVWDAVAASYDDPNTMGARLNDAGGATDPLTKPVPGTYLTGTAGEALGAIAALSAGGVTVLSPMDSTTSNITGLVKGASYTGPDVLLWVDTGDDWPTIAGAQIAITVEVETGGTANTIWAATATTSGSPAHKAVSLSLSTAQTSALVVRDSRVYEFKIWATTTDVAEPHAVTARTQLVTGTMTVTD